MSTSHDVVEIPGEPPHVHHMDVPTAYHAAKFGMWLFLATEVLLFGGLFAGFAIYRWMYLPAFHLASHHLDWKLGSLNTLVLLFSSLTAALAVDSAQKNDNKKATKYLTITILCGFAFLVIKFFEYRAKYYGGIFPGGPEFNGFSWQNPAFIAHYKTFFGLYFCMTGLHALHVIFGMGLLFWVRTKTVKNRFSAKYYTPVEVGALYWHLVDLIWIYLFPLLYLVG